MHQQIIKNLPNYDADILKPYLERVVEAKKHLTNHSIAALDIANQIDDLAEISHLANKINQQFKKVFVLGVGGSSLGGKTLSAISDHKDNITFLESIDSATIAKNLVDIDWKNSLFLVISKSGETIETICQTLIFIEKFKQNNITDLSKNFIFITQNHHNSLAKIAGEIKAPIYHHPENIGGRFSYLTIVGLLPAAIIGLDITAIRQCAKKVLNNFIQQDVADNQIIQAAIYQLYLFDAGFNNNVIMPYIDALKDFTDWYRQLWAESLGKNHFGSTPITSMGTVDQHSQLQLYLDGPKDKFFTFITNQNPKQDFQIVDLKSCPTLFGGKNLNEIVKIEQNSTIEVLNQKHLPIRILEVKELNEGALSALMMQMFLETILIADVKNINPFDQPAVELRKDLAKKYLAS